MTRLRGATVYVHWSVFAVTAVMMLSAIENAAAGLLLWAALWASR